MNNLLHAGMTAGLAAFFGVALGGKPTVQAYQRPYLADIATYATHLTNHTCRFPFCS